MMSDYLIHYGVKGMKWGVRNDPEPLNRRARKRLIKNEQYRQKLLAKSQSQANSSLEKAKKYRSQYEDIKRHGVESKTWQKEVDHRSTKAATKGDTFNDIISKSLEVETKRYSKQEMEHHRIDLKYKAQEHEKAAKNWMKTNSDLMNMKITSSTSKRDIRKAYSGNQSNSLLGKYKPDSKKHAIVQVGSMAGIAGGAVASRYISNKVNSTLFAGNPAAQKLAGTFITAGSVYAGQQLGRYGGQAISNLMYRKK